MGSSLNIATVILAAGRGTRMGDNGKSKVLMPVHGVPMLARVVDAVRSSATSQDIIVVVGSEYGATRSILGDKVQYVVQAAPRGTGDAVISTQSVLEGRSDGVLVLYGDHPFVRAGTLRNLAELFARTHPAIAMVTTTVSNFSDWRATFADFGRIVRDTAGDLVAIVEARDASIPEQSIREVNPGMYCFDAVWLWENLLRLTPAKNGEYYLTDLVKLAMAQGKSIATMPIPPEECLGVNTLSQLDVVSTIIPAVA